MAEPADELGRFQHTLEDGRVQCDLCPRACRLHDGQRAFCFVRERRGADIYLTSYGRASGFCVDPIEKKPLFHFYPGSSVLSFGTAGCNLGCKFCQNWDISKARQVEKLSALATPLRVAAAAAERGCASVAFTYNDPVIFAEYAIDSALACRERGIRSVAVTAGYITSRAREEFFRVMDAANVDLKAFTEGFYEKLCFARLGPVLETLEYLRHETRVWFEVTTLLIPGLNDSEAEIDRLSAWFMEHLGPDVPLHFTAFHPDYRLTEVARTPPETCLRARQQARAHGLRYVYAGNIRGGDAECTDCPTCQTRLVARDWYELGAYTLNGDACAACGTRIPGRFASHAPGAWGRRRLRVALS
jgi:pyruvate formate lyase activating enzyme